ncbi:AAA family ATPase [Nannocystis punicea]|uniref:AAA family ATPase n=1 Tax=Nannocystis punicea TaxID=2995304 RepID=A0ABY7H211_9BACT|nr:AAA family ATPase [Nannocystis poenicansa]WAS93232.1 AAA family ATPase [Nannocystis poenicansa]
MTSTTEYTLTEAIHESASTVVYRGYRNHDKLAVIVKRLKSALPTAAEIAKIKYEYAVTRGLNLPGVAKVYGLETIGNNLALIVESRGGLALSEVIGQRELTTKETLTLAVSIAGTLESLHQSGVIHMDVKPHNIIVDMATLEAKITDFGSATRLSQEAQKVTSPAALEGTLAYVSPEQTGRVSYSIDSRTDLYSLGVSLYEMTTGVLPFDTTDFMDLVHSHIARLPKPPHEVKRGTPKVLSDIITRLLAKSPDDRYQTAHGLRADLVECLERLATKATIDSFPLGRHDFVDKLRIPQKLYGREAELAVIREVWKRASEGPIELLLVSGYSGIGKTALVNEIHQTIAQSNGYFVAGKFDHLNRATPYAAVAHVFRELIRTILTEPPESLAAWRGRLKDAVGANGQLLVDFIPELELVIGQQEPVQALGPTEAQNRFNLTFKNFCRAFPSQQRPLALFLDDLQWADPASLRLLQALLTESDLSHMLVLGAYRDNEVDATHLFAMTLAEIRKAQANVSEITLEPLARPTVSQLIADTLGCPRERSEPLAALVFATTQGNPFFIGQFLKTLHQKKLLYFDLNSRAWAWDMAGIQRTKVTDNVIDFMAEKIQQLPVGAQKVLTLAACIGHTFDLHTLSLVAGKSRREVAAELWEALRAGLVVPTDADSRFFEVSAQEGQQSVEEELIAAVNATYRFLHDRVQQAAYSIVPEPQRQAQHLVIGRLMLANGRRDDGDGELFEIAGHMSRGASLITDPAERLAVARLDLDAGRRAAEGAAYDAAARYLESGLSLLEERSWTDEYALTLAIHTELAAAKYLSGDFTAAERLLKAALAHARDDVDRARVHGSCLTFYMAFGKLMEAVKSGLTAVSLLGVEIPESAEQRAAMLVGETRALQATLQTRTISELVDLPAVTDPAKQAVITILADLASVAIAVDPSLGPLLVAKLVNYSIEHGNAFGSAFGYGLHAVLCLGGIPNYGGTPDRYREAYEFSKLSTELNERRKDARLTCRLLAMHAALLHFFEPLAAVLKALERVRQVGFESGDLAFASYSCIHLISTKLARGDELEELEEEIDQNLKLMERTNERMTTLILKGAKQVIATLKGLTAGWNSWDSEGFDEAAFLRTGEENKLSTVVGWYYTLKQQLCYLYGDFAGALTLLEPLEKVIAGWSSHFFTTDVTFYACLTYAALCDTSPPEQKERYLEIIAQRQTELGRWAELCVANYGHKHTLVKAEVARVRGREDEAATLYDQAIDLAKENGFWRDAAMASEVCARFYLGKGRTRIARAYMTDAYHGYLYWGATAKMEDLMARFPELITQGVTLPGARDVRSSSPSPRRRPSSTTKLNASFLNVEAVIRSAQVIAGEVVLEKVVDRLMDVVIKSAGAQKGVLILERERRLIVQASRSVDGAGAANPGVPIETSSDIPRSVVQYVARTGDAVISGDVSQEPRFAADPYVAANQPKSILCLSMTHQGRATGMLYLENSIAKNAFSEAQTELLKLFLTQAAIAVENALLYKHVQERTEALYRTEEQLRVEFTERERSEQARVALQEEIIRVQNERLAELSTPFIPITDRVMVMPLIGTMDSKRAQEVLATALQGAQANRAEVVIIDITGVNIVDTDVASTLLRTASALRLLGVLAVLTGIRPNVAQALISLQIDFGGIVTQGTLQNGIAYALERTSSSLTGHDTKPR